MHYTLFSTLQGEIVLQTHAILTLLTHFMVADQRVIRVQLHLSFLLEQTYSRVHSASLKSFLRVKSEVANTICLVYSHIHGRMHG